MKRLRFGAGCVVGMSHENGFGAGGGVGMSHGNGFSAGVSDAGVSHGNGFSAGGGVGMSHENGFSAGGGVPPCRGAGTSAGKRCGNPIRRGENASRAGKVFMFSAQGNISFVRLASIHCIPAVFRIRVQSVWDDPRRSPSGGHTQIFPRRPVCPSTEKPSDPMNGGPIHLDFFSEPHYIITIS